MLSYLKAESYKLLHRKYTYWFLAVVLALEALLVAGWVYTNANGNGVDFYFGVVVLIKMLYVGLYAAVITGDLAFSEQYKFNTLKNEVSYGLPRTRIYLGKLIMSCLVAVVSCLIIVVFYVGACALLLPHGEMDAEVLSMLWYCLATALPLWLGGQALVILSFFLIKSSTVASFLVVGILVGAGQIFQVMGMLVNKIFLQLYNLMLSTPFDQMGGTVGDWAFCGKAWLIGMGWFVATTAAGLYFFRKKEIS